ncbi:unnamed protein product [Candida verbasci]|uniref:RING-type domain-containing protein n=1 Tax=Candida verbasci TaxID=1227364 RepID=A0A9W4U0P7_9ASCO|nr:unnamed protein product [Candida verbasci]
MNGTSIYTNHSLDHQQSSICDNLQQPIFKLEEVQLQFQLNNKLKKLLVFKNIMFIIMESICYRIDLDNPSQVNKLNLPISNGNYINCWTNGDIFILRIDLQYFQLIDFKFKPLPKFKGMDIIQILFNTCWIIATKDTIYIQDMKIKQVFKGNNIQGISMNKVQINLIVNFELYTWDYFDSTFDELVNVFKTQPLIKSIKPSENFLFTTTDQIFLYISDGFLTNDDQIQSINDEIESFRQVILSPHHIIGYSTSISIFNKINLNKSKLSLDNIIGITTDYINKTYWIYTKNSIHELIIENESASIWYDYYKMGNYVDALKCLEDTEDYSKRDLVLTKQGYDYLQKGGFGVALDNESIDLQLKGIRNLANSSEPFEKICLMLLQDTMIVSDKLLIEYLTIKFEHYKKEKNKIKIIVLSSWIVELMEDPKSFIKANYKLLDPPTMYEILKDPIYYAELIEDYKFILNHYLNNKNYSQTAKILHKLEPEDIYQSSTILLLNYPKVTEMWLRIPNLQYERFIPAILLYCKKNSPTPIIQFLQKIHEKGYKSKTLNNYYLTLLIESGHDKQFIKFIQSERLYDQNFILRLCIANTRYQPAIIIYISWNLFKQALDLALKNNLTNLAELVLTKYEEHIEEESNSPTTSSDDLLLQQESYSTRKKLWLIFAKHLIDNLGNTTDFLHDDNTLNGVLKYILGNSILGLKDLLPLFPENIMVNDFKDEIVKTLNEYNNKINQLSIEMKESIEISSNLKQQLKESKLEKSKIYSIIEPGEPCRLCNELLIAKNFIIFPNCNHGFHKECLIVNLSKSNNYKFKKIYQNFKKNPEINKNELTEIIVKDCLLCNSSNINSIDTNFELSSDWNL